MLSQSDLRDAVNYDPETGVFTWRKPISNKFRPGDIAGAEGAGGYIRLWIYGHRGSAHRLAWLYVYGVMPSEQIDHINGNRKDNRISNLRTVSNLENSKNQRLAKNNKSGIPGVKFREDRNYWSAAISNGRQIHLGSFDTLLDAACARRSAELAHGFHDNHGSPKP